MGCTCPLCGTKNVKLPTIVFFEDRRLLLARRGIITLSHVETVLVRMLLSAGPKGVHREDAIMRVYEECRDPDNPPTDRSFIIACAHLRKKLEVSRAPIRLSRAKPHDQYLRLEKQNAKKAVHT